jgi:hypothetical protein
MPRWRPGTVVAAVLGLVLLAGCSAAGAGPEPSGSSPASSSAAVTGDPTGPASSSGRIVTVPGLSSGSAGDPAPGTAGSASATDHSTPPPRTSPSTRTGTRTVGSAAEGSATAPASSSPSAGSSGQSGPAGQEDPGAPETSASPDASSNAGSGSGGSTSTTSEQTRPSSAAGQGSSVTVDLSNCAGCTAIATHRAVTGTLSAALVTTSKGAVLLSVRPDGSPAGIINVPYGASFSPPAGGTLPCDSAARCIVTGRQPDGTAILSAFELSADGAWRDMSGSAAFPSATAQGRAADLDGDGVLEIAVQESADGRTNWLVFSWSGDRFTLLGCAPASDTLPSAGDLSRDGCLS